MKKLYSLTAIILIFFSCFGCYFKPTPAFAQSYYRRVIDNQTPFYKSILDNEPLFYLPYTYYVRILGEENAFSHVEIHGEGQVALDGYVPSNLLYDDGLVVYSPYLKLSITTIDTTTLYSDTLLSIPIQYIFAERSLGYYGEYFSPQGRIFFVSYNNKLGYIKESDVFPFTINLHPNELTFITTPEISDEPNEESTQKTTFDLKSIIFVCLLFAGIISIFIAFSNKSKQQKNISYYEENDYE